MQTEISAPYLLGDDASGRSAGRSRPGRSTRCGAMAILRHPAGTIEREKALAVWEKSSGLKIHRPQSSRLVGNLRKPQRRRDLDFPPRAEAYSDGRNADAVNTASGWFLLPLPSTTRSWPTVQERWYEAEVDQILNTSAMQLIWRLHRSCRSAIRKHLHQPSGLHDDVVCAEYDRAAEVRAAEEDADIRALFGELSRKVKDKALHAKLEAAANTEDRSLKISALDISPTRNCTRY